MTSYQARQERSPHPIALPGNRIAIASDIHGDATALEQFCSETNRQGAVGRVNLGDLVGRGGQSLRCVRWAPYVFGVNLGGNHEHGVVNPEYRSAEEYIRAQWDEAAVDIKSSGLRWLDSLHHSAAFTAFGTKFHAHHASPEPARHWERYTHPSDAHNPDFWEHVPPGATFVGHTHVPALMTPGHYEALVPGKRYALPERGVVNPGSLSQPRDGDERGSYLVISSDGTFQLFRLHAPRTSF